MEDEVLAWFLMTESGSSRLNVRLKHTDAGTSRFATDRRVLGNHGEGQGGGTIERGELSARAS